MWKPMLVVCMALTVAIDAVSNCAPEIKSFDFQAAFCKSDMTFKGAKKSSKSSISMNEDGKTIVTATADFVVDEYLKNTAAPHDKLVTVFRSYIKDDECKTSFFDGPGDSYLVFAHGSDIKSFHCGFGIPLQCVPQAVLDGFSNLPCPRCNV